MIASLFDLSVKIPVEFGLKSLAISSVCPDQPALVLATAAIQAATAKA
jgi:hypothetical protein